ncbi:uncharacterized protein KY384_003439 [Bacidia gigantensis]|uniref:uncharacterized protein n=1 Tax=Bacidia gigantensis TaxID=2732470 RepID=UPI001D04CCFE|nr:uncharacterized protein KY384_003439 [Bacidia gigantensis]KAG8531803.1 hypothetical protein KY384_003439 [Bacidia gigantensis]
MQPKTAIAITAAAGVAQAGPLLETRAKITDLNSCETFDTNNAGVVFKRDAGFACDGSMCKAPKVMSADLCNCAKPFDTNGKAPEFRVYDCLEKFPSRKLAERDDEKVQRPAPRSMVSMVGRTIAGEEVAAPVEADVVHVSGDCPATGAGGKGSVEGGCVHLKE